METSQKESRFSWLKLIRDAELSGFSAMLATHSEPKKYDPIEVELHLEVHVSMEKYLAGDTSNELLLKLRGVLGERLSIVWTAGAAENSPAIKARTKRVARITDAVASLQKDPFLNVVLFEMGGKVIRESISPEN